MDIIYKNPDKIILRIDANETLANAIRRSVDEIPVLAIDEVEIYKNDSALYDEVLAHRIGLVPLKTEKSMSSKTKIDLKLSKTGPCTVYSEDLKGPADIIYPKIPLVILGDGHKLELLATAVLSKGITHAKYSPGLCYYRFLYDIKSSSEIDTIIFKNKGQVKPVKKDNTWRCDLNESEITQIEKINPSAISKSNELVFIIESYGNIPAPDMLTKAIKALEENLDEFENTISK